MTNYLHPLYQLWKGMRGRCNCPSNISYPNYGARGITVCDRWDDFQLFVEDMGERPQGFTLDRIDNEGPYSPDNCQWSSWSSQQTNRRIFIRSWTNHDDPMRYICKQRNKFKLQITIRPNTRIRKDFHTLSEALDFRSDLEMEREMFRVLL